MWLWRQNPPSETDQEAKMKTISSARNTNKADGIAASSQIGVENATTRPRKAFGDRTNLQQGKVGEIDSLGDQLKNLGIKDEWSDRDNHECSDPQPPQSPDRDVHSKEGDDSGVQAVQDTGDGSPLVAHLSPTCFPFHRDLFPGCEDYVDDISAYFFHLQHRHAITEEFMSKCEMRAEQRSSQMDRMTVLHSRLETRSLCPEVLCLAVHLFDFFIQCEGDSIEPSRLRLVTDACLNIARKFELGVLSYFDDPSYRSSVFQARMELRILRCVDFFLGRPTAFHFVFRLLPIWGKAPNSPSYRAWASLILEVVISELDFAHLLPSRVGAAVAFVARRASGLPASSLTSAMLAFALHPIDEWRPLVPKIAARVLEESSRHSVIIRKYTRGPALNADQLAALRELTTA